MNNTNCPIKKKPTPSMPNVNNGLFNNRKALPELTLRSAFMDGRLFQRLRGLHHPEAGLLILVFAVIRLAYILWSPLNRREAPTIRVTGLKNRIYIRISNVPVFL